MNQEKQFSTMSRKIDNFDYGIDLNEDSDEDYIELPKIECDQSKYNIFQRDTDQRYVEHAHTEQKYVEHMYTTNQGYVEHGVQRVDHDINSVTKKAWKANVYTLPCVSVYLPISCPHGDKCHYAHSKSEFKPKECRMKQHCLGVVQIGRNTYRNSKFSKTCRFIHPYESLTSICSRLAIPNKPKKLGPIDLSK
jgi:hypothetical protein